MSKLDRVGSSLSLDPTYMQLPFSELGARLRARRQFPPAIHVRTRSLLLTTAQVSV